jgi:hypothetical protein
MSSIEFSDTTGVSTRKAKRMELMKGTRVIYARPTRHRAAIESVRSQDPDGPGE